MCLKITVLLLPLLVSTCTHSMAHYRTYSVGSIIDLSGKVGDSIDAMERSEYELFPSIEGFKEAMFFRIPEGGYEIQIAAADGRYIAVNRDPDGVDILKDYFTQYDPTHKDLHSFEREWGVIGYDALGFPITQQEVIQGNDYGCSCFTTTGCTLVSVGLSLLIALGYAFEHEFDDQSAINRNCVFIIAGGAVVGVGTGYLAGRIIDRTRAVRAIERARMPARIE